jgi:hypothetical protein
MSDDFPCLYKGVYADLQPDLAGCREGISAKNRMKIKMRSIVCNKSNFAKLKEFLNCAG